MKTEKKFYFILTLWKEIFKAVNKWGGKLFMGLKTWCRYDTNFPQSELDSPQFHPTFWQEVLWKSIQ